MNFHLQQLKPIIKPNEEDLHDHYPRSVLSMHCSVALPGYEATSLWALSRALVGGE